MKKSIIFGNNFYDLDVNGLAAGIYIIMCDISYSDGSREQKSTKLIVTD